jgi:hypothetical protein
VLQVYTPGFAGLSTVSVILVNTYNKMSYVTEGHIVYYFVSYGKLMILRVGMAIMIFSSTIRATSAKGLLFLLGSFLYLTHILHLIPYEMPLFI